MKKLMIAAAIVCAAAMSQAAALSWSTWGYSLDGGTTGEEVWEGNTGAAYLVMVTDAANFAVGNDLAITGGTVVDSIANDGTGSFGGLWNTTLSDGEKYLFAIVATTAGTGAKNTDGYIMPTTGFFGVDRNGDNSTASGFYEATWSADTGATIFPFEGTDALDFEDAYYGVSMSTAVAPEPTSGLLLLLGVAGLALKRRRA